MGCMLAARCGNNNSVEQNRRYPQSDRKRRRVQ